MATLVYGAIVMICVLNLGIVEVKVEEKTDYCLSFSKVFPITWIFLINIPAVIIARMQEGNKSLGLLKNMQFGWEYFYFTSCRSGNI